MTNARAVPLGHYTTAIALGVYASLIALAPTRTIQLSLIVPLVVLPVGLWLLAEPARWIIVFLCCALVLPPLPIAMGDSGPHIGLVVAAIGVLAGVVRIHEWQLRREPLHLGMLSYGCVLAASVCFAAIYSGFQVAAASLARVLLFAISIYAFYYTAYGPGSDKIGQQGRTLRFIYWAGVASALFACVDFYYQLPAPAGFGPQFVWLESGVFRRAQGVFYEASTLGNLCAFFLLLIAACLARRDQPFSRTALLVGTIVFGSALMLSFSRASLVNLAVALTILLFLHRQGIGFRRLVVLPSIALGTAAAVSYLVFPRFTAFYWERLIASGAYLFTAPEGILSGRLESWRILWQFVAEHPWHAVFGVGYKTLPYSDFIGRTVVADNAYLGALVETGVIGLTAMLLFNITVLRIAWRAGGLFGSCLFCFWIGEMLQMMSGDLLTYWRVLPVYLWMLGIAARNRNEPSPARSIQ